MAAITSVVESSVYMQRSRAIPVSAFGSEIRSQNPDSVYRTRAREHLIALAAVPDVNLFSAARAARGLFPSEVQALLSEAGVSLPAGDLPPSARYPGPQLHAAEFEWYFAQETREELSSLLAGTKTLLLGAPTLLEALRSRHTDCDLVDRSPFLDARFPALRLRWRRHDLRSPLGALRSHRAVFFDAPWHEDHIARWLWQASLAVCRGGHIAFALFGELTRPSASVERERLLGLAAGLGRVEVVENFLEYDTPGFEACALNASGTPLEGPWRRGDLVRIHNVRGSMPPPPKPIEFPWVTLLRGTEVWKVRREVCSRLGEVSAATRLESVGRRRTLCGQHDLITSRQIAARLETPSQR